MNDLGISTPRVQDTKSTSISNVTFCHISGMCNSFRSLLPWLLHYHSWWGSWHRNKLTRHWCCGKKVAAADHSPPALKHTGWFGWRNLHPEQAEQWGYVQTHTWDQKQWNYNCTDSKFFVLVKFLEYRRFPLTDKTDGLEYRTHPWQALIKMHIPALSPYWGLRSSSKHWLPSCCS